MKKIISTSALILALCSSLWAVDYNVTEFGAKADGMTLNTRSIQAAIDLASANGGGRVIVPAGGEFVTGSIYLKSNVDLHLEDGAVLLGSLNPWDYVKDSVIKWTAMIFAVQQDNISITGKGVIDNRGFEVANRMVQYVHLGLFQDDLGLDRPQEANRPEIIHLFKCNNVTVKDVTLKDPACWTQQYELCNKLTIEGIKVDAKAYWNNDGLDVVDCCDVIVRNCYIDSSDDAYCFKSHHVDGVSENVLVENCIGRSSASGVKFGTLTKGVFRHFVFKDITIFDTFRSAINIASVDEDAWRTCLLTVSRASIQATPSSFVSAHATPTATNPACRISSKRTCTQKFPMANRMRATSMKAPFPCPRETSAPVPSWVFPSTGSRTYASRTWR